MSRVRYSRSLVATRGPHSCWRRGNEATSCQSERIHILMCQNPKKKKNSSPLGVLSHSNISNRHANWPWIVDHIVTPPTVILAARLHLGKFARSQYPVPATQAPTAILPRMSLFRKTFLSRHVFCCGLKGLELGGWDGFCCLCSSSAARSKQWTIIVHVCGPVDLLFWGLREFTQAWLQALQHAISS